MDTLQVVKDVVTIVNSLVQWRPENIADVRISSRYEVYPLLD